MSLPVVLTDEAEVDFDAAADWYEEQAGLGAKFTMQVRLALTRTGELPELHAVLHGNIRRAKVQKFPCQIYHRVRHDRVEVIAVLHCRRDPTRWKDPATRRFDRIEPCGIDRGQFPGYASWSDGAGLVAFDPD